MGTYKIGEKIGERYVVHDVKMGGMGVVYLCYDQKDLMPIALKTLQFKSEIGKSIPKLLERELLIWIRLENHPNIVHCYNLENDGINQYIALEWIMGGENQGTSLRDWINRGPLDLRQAINFSIDICRGMVHANEKQPGIVHSDIKPENVLVSQGRVAKVTDFGLAQVAKVVHSNNYDRNHETSDIFHLSNKGGTPIYMAPEQWLGDTLDARTDVYAIGCILFELLTGNRFFDAANIKDLMKQHLDSSFISKLKQYDLPKSISNILYHSIVKDKGTRINSPKQMWELLSDSYIELFKEEPRTLTSKEFTVNDYNNRGTTYDELHYYKDAISDYSKAIALAPDDFLSYYNRAGSYRRINLFAEALEDYNIAMSLNPYETKVLVNRGLTFDDLGRCDDALDDFAQSISINPEEASAYYNRGEIFTRLGRYTDAITDYDNAINLNPNYVKAYLSRSAAHYELKNYELSMHDALNVLKINPTNDKAYTNQGAIFEAIGNFEKAIESYDKAIELNPTSAKAYRNRGLLYVRKQHYPKALEDFNEAIRFDPSLVRTYVNRGTVYEKFNMHKEALEDYNRAIEFSPELPDVYFNRGNVYKALLRFNDALADYARAIELNELFSPAYINRAAIFEALQLPDKALEELNRVIAFDHQNSVAVLNRGLVYGKQNRHEDALADFVLTIKLDPTNSLAMISAGIALIQSNRFKEARHYFEMASNLGNELGTQYALLVEKELRKLSS